MGIWRTTITHAVEGSLVISEPEGLASAIIGLTRHPEFHSLIKEFKSSFRSYGSNGTQDGGREFLKNIERTYGPDSVVNILCEYSDDDRFTFDTVFEGEVGIQTFVEGLEMDHTIELTPVQKGFWRKAMSRFDTVVDIQSALDLDGNVVDVLTPEVLNLPSQVVRYNGEYDQQTTNFTYVNTGSLAGCQLDWENVIIDDVQKYNIDRDVFDLGTDDENAIVGNFAAPWDGSYRVRAKVISGVGNVLGGGPDWSADSSDFLIRLRKVGSSVFVDGDNSIDSTPASGNTFLRSSIDTVINLLKGDQVIIYGVNTGFNRTVFGKKRLDWKTNCLVMTTINIVLSGEQTIDGVLTNNDRVLVRSQGNPEENGIYVSNAGAWTRATDSDSEAELNNSAVLVFSGDTGAQSYWNQVRNINQLGVDAIEWVNIPLSVERLIPYDGEDVDNYLEIIADTTYRATEHEAFLTHDVAASICDRITESGRFYSELFGSPYTQARTYLGSGAWWNNVNIKGVHLRGYSLTEKLFSNSLKKWWDNANPMFNLSMGYERIAGVDVIRVEEKAHCYDDSSMTVLLSNVQRIKRKYNNSQYFNAVENGYSKGKVEDISGIDDPQKQFRASIFKNIGQKITLFTEWIGQSISIEVTRRTTRTKSADYKLDDDTFIIEVTRDGDGEYSPRLEEDFDAVTGLLNEETRYNKHHTPARFFLRWLNYLSGCLQNYVGTVFRFTGGEGNYDMTSEMVDGSAPDDYDGGNLAENADIPVSQDILYIPIEFEIEHYLTMGEFNLIDANRTKAIGVSQTDTDHQAFFITDLQLEVISGQIKLMGYFKEPFDIRNVPQSSTIVQGGRIFDATFDSSFE